MIDFCKILEDAECCFGKLGAKWASLATFGNDDQKLYYDWLALGCLINTLEENMPEHYLKKEKISLTEQVVDFSTLKRKNNVLFLDSKTEYRCIEVSIQKCLSEEELQKIANRIKQFCSYCYNCN